MKTKYIIISLISILFISYLSSCAKDEEKKEPTKLELVSEKVWEIDDITMDPGITYMGIAFTDASMFLEECMTDNTYKFQKDGKTIMNEGPTKCNDTDPDEIQEGTWEFNADKTKMIFSGSAFLGEMNMESLTTDKLVLTRIETLPDTTVNSITIPGGDQKIIITYIH